MFEMESMYSNMVWDLVEPPNKIQPIGYKWISKMKREADKWKSLKQGLLQKGSLKMRESSVAMLKSIRILLSSATHFDYEILQMDVKAAFLNGNLDEYIYMVQPDNFITKG